MIGITKMTIRKESEWWVLRWDDTIGHFRSWGQMRKWWKDNHEKLEHW